MDSVAATGSSEASVLLLRRIMDTHKSQALALIEAMSSPPALGPGQGGRVDVYA
jgi:hypothetical protein